MKALAIFNREDVDRSEAREFRTRLTTRAVLFDKNSNIALLHQLSKDWYGLPGGGVEHGEIFEQGIIRECKEEIGCTVEIKFLIGKTLEFRKQDNFINETRGYIAHIIGEKRNPDPEDETNDSEIIWISIKEAIHLIENTPVQKNLYSQYCIERDLVFLKKAQEMEY